MNLTKLPDELIEKWGRFYTSDYVKTNRPDVYKLPFIEWVEKQAREIGYKIA